MIFAYIVCLSIGLASLFLTTKLSFLARFGVAVAIAVVLAIGVTLLLKKIGDRAPADAITVVPESPEKKK